MSNDDGGEQLTFGRKVGVAVSGSGVRVWLPDGQQIMLTLDDAKQLRLLLNEAGLGD